MLDVTTRVHADASSLQAAHRSLVREPTTCRTVALRSTFGLCTGLVRQEGELGICLIRPAVLLRFGHSTLRFGEVAATHGYPKLLSKGLATALGSGCSNFQRPFVSDICQGGGGARLPEAAIERPGDCVAFHSESYSICCLRQVAATRGYPKLLSKDLATGIEIVLDRAGQVNPLEPLSTHSCFVPLLFPCCSSLFQTFSAEVGLLQRLR